MRIETVKKLIDDSYRRCTTMADFKVEIDSILEAYEEDSKYNINAPLICTGKWAMNSTGGVVEPTGTVKKDIEFIITNLEKTEE